MSDRLKDLQRQRALAQEQLAWFDREIARETGTQVLPPSAPTAPAARVPPSPPSTQPATPSDADAIIAQYQDPGRSVHSETKRGCLLYFFAALGALILGLTAFWFLKHR